MIIFVATHLIESNIEKIIALAVEVVGHYKLGGGATCAIFCGSFAGHVLKHSCEMLRIIKS